jgi:hypothetical protein
MLFNLRLRVAPPLNRPEAWASVTVPTARVPTGITVLPLTTTGEENVASKLWPGSLILDPTDCTSLTRRVVPAGMTTGAGGGGGVDSTGGAGAVASMGVGSGDAGEAEELGGAVGSEDGAAEDGPAGGAAGAGEFDEVCEELVSDEAGADDVLLHAVHQTTRLRSNVDGSTILVRIETSFQKSV